MKPIMATSEVRNASTVSLVLVVGKASWLAASWKNRFMISSLTSSESLSCVDSEWIDSMKASLFALLFR